VHLIRAYLPIPKELKGLSITWVAAKREMRMMGKGTRSAKGSGCCKRLIKMGVLLTLSIIMSLSQG
jgi:hypothetical protein